MEKQIIIIVTVSVLFHTIMNLRLKIFSKKMLYLIGYTLFISLSANKDNPEFSVNKMLLAIPVCFVAGLGGLYKNEVLPAINERIIHLVSLIYLYSIIINTSFFKNIYFPITSIIPVIIAIYYAITMKPLLSHEKLFYNT